MNEYSKSFYVHHHLCRVVEAIVNDRESCEMKELHHDWNRRMNRMEMEEINHKYSPADMLVIRHIEWLVTIAPK